MLRKINAVISLFITLLLLDHAIFHAVWMLSEGKIEKSASKMTFMLFGFMILHAILCIVILIRSRKGATVKNGKGYAKMNAQTYVQRISGMLLIVFVVLHIVGAVGVLNAPKVVYAILQPLFFALCLAHVAISTSKAFVTLGVGNAKVIKVVDITVKVICAITLVADVIGFYLYVC